MCMRVCVFVLDSRVMFGCGSSDQPLLFVFHYSELTFVLSSVQFKIQGDSEAEIKKQ